MSGQEVVVIGAGVIGLTSAVQLAEAGHRVGVVAAEPPRATTSAAAGALWGPWLVEPRERCTRLEPSLANATVVEHRVGLRPTRSTVRVEAERSATGRLIVHNYGHSGAGVSLAWGCAQEVASLLSGDVAAE